MPSRIRQHALDEARDRVIRIAKLRPPQLRSFDAVHKIISGFNDDLPTIDETELIEHLRGIGLDVPIPPPQLIFSLATGVGKTRLMGALIAYLYSARQTRNCLILAPRSAILEKLERESEVGNPKYLFIEPRLVPEPNLCFRESIESFRPSPDRLNVFILSPQSITGTDRRFARDSEFRGFSLLDYLQGLRDLVVFVDEAHHLGSAADDATVWMTAVQNLHPRLYFGLTATPRTGPGVNTICEYDLRTCLREGYYTKAVDLIVEERDDAVSDEDWDKYTIDFAMRRLERKKVAIREFRRILSTFPSIEPVLLICANNTQHADEIGKWLVDARGIPKEEILITHSERAKTEDDIKRLVAIDQPSNRVRIVVNVFQLTEGWDVTNVYVIAPLRAMATYRNAVQTMGRGLRLPAGRRVDNRDVDTLDVLCCGRESVGEILREATKQFGSSETGVPLSITPRLELDNEQLIPTKEITIKAVKDISISVPLVKRIDTEPPLDFSVESLGKLMQGGATALHLDTLERTGLNESVTYRYEDFVASVHSKVLVELSYLSEPLNGEALEHLIRNFLDALGARQDQQIEIDPVKVALLLADEIDKRYRRQTIRFELVDNVSIAPGDYQWRVPEEFSNPSPRMPLEEWK